MKAPAPPIPTKTGGGGDQDEIPQVGAVTAAPEDQAPIKCRKEWATSEDFSFAPHSLVGSWFHRLENETMIERGVIVAEPQPGVYLLQVDRIEPGAENVQRLATIQQLTNDDDGYGWHFYDSENEAKSAYANWIAHERQRA